MLAWTYTSLFDALKAWPVEIENQTYEDDLPTIIGLGHVRLIRDLNLSIFDVTDESLTLDEGERLVTKPTGIIATRSLRIGKIISSTAEVAADDDSLCVAQVPANVQAALTLNGAAVVAGVGTFTIPRRVTVTETLLSIGGIEVILTGTDKNGFKAQETVTTLENGRVASSLNLWLTLTGIQARMGDGTRQVKVGGAVARGGVVIGETWPLELRSKEWCQAYAPDRREVNRPVYFNEHSSTQWELVDSADQDYAVISHHVARPQELTASFAGPTWLSSSVPDGLFAACLMEAEHYLKADDRYADYQSKYAGEIIPAARLELRNLIRLGDRGPFSPTMSAAGG